MKKVHRSGFPIVPQTIMPSKGGVIAHNFQRFDVSKDGDNAKGCCDHKDGTGKVVAASEELASVVNVDVSVLLHNPMVRKAMAEGSSLRSIHANKSDLFVYISN